MTPNADVINPVIKSSDRLGTVQIKLAQYLV
ncbi:hypothetical protein Pse7367_1011 [Thalassoporum mexicanum PCC 7367]|nr:hypothetical protein Pse7367_1011 [Pseudanabaena sp. PCC 7367]